MWKGQWRVPSKADRSSENAYFIHDCFLNMGQWARVPLRSGDIKTSSELFLSGRFLYGKGKQYIATRLPPAVIKCHLWQVIAGGCEGC